ncbi:MAG TPA: L,D-transpeptidase family protein [Candidatus Binataceae bacterium]|nr:L,D-transpeptidase family protein [Candidatus Binataceae bacterium]
MRLVPGLALMALLMAAGLALSVQAESATIAASPSPLATPVAIATLIATPSPLARPSPVATPSLIATPSPLATPSRLASPSPVATPSPTAQSIDHGLTPGEIALSDATDQEVADPLNWNVLIYKSRHELTVYFQGHRYKTYRAVFGRSLESGTKEWAGDRRTPEGVYTIIGKRRHRRWRYFLALNYPNNQDRARYVQMRTERLIPVARGRALTEGSEIGIHGTDEPILNSGDVNWTTGCISVDNSAIEELEALLPTGTVVIIKP